MRGLYLDNAATTRPALYMLDGSKILNPRKWGNPSSLHKIGREANGYIDECKKKIFDSLNVPSQFFDIYFTSGATEANNIALLGLRNNRRYRHIVTTTVEHHSVLNTINVLKEIYGFKVTYIDPYRDIAKSLVEIDEPFIFVMMATNNETGDSYNIEKISKYIKETAHYDAIIISDMTQAITHIDFDKNRLKSNIDMFTFSGHKFHCEPMIGVLVVSKRVYCLEPIMYGGQQQNRLRPSTENVRAIYNIASNLEAVRELNKIVDEKTKKWCREFENVLKKYVVFKINSNNDTINVVNFQVKDVPADALCELLSDKYNIYIGFGSACDTKSYEASATLLQKGCTYDEAMCSVRISFDYIENKALRNPLIRRICFKRIIKSILKIRENYTILLSNHFN